MTSVNEIELASFMLQLAIKNKRVTINQNVSIPVQIIHKDDIEPQQSLQFLQQLHEIEIKYDDENKNNLYTLFLTLSESIMFHIWNCITHDINIKQFITSNKFIQVAVCDVIAYVYTLVSRKQLSKNFTAVPDPIHKEKFFYTENITFYPSVTIIDNAQNKKFEWSRSQSDIIDYNSNRERATQKMKLCTNVLIIRPNLM